MADKSFGVAVVIAAIIVFGWLIPWMTWGAVTVNGATYRGVAPANAVTLINASAISTPAASTYDSFDAPLGTPFTVAADRTLFVVGFRYATATSTTLTLGYADTHVSASTSTPANPVTVWSGLITATSEQVAEYEVPAGAIPWAQASTWYGPVQLLGYTR